MRSSLAEVRLSTPMRRIFVAGALVLLLATYGFSTTITGAQSSTSTWATNHNNGLSAYYYPYSYYEYSYCSGYDWLGNCDSWTPVYGTAYSSGGTYGTTSSSTAYQYLPINLVDIPSDATLLSATVDWSSVFTTWWWNGGLSNCARENSSYGYSCGSFEGVLTGSGQSFGIYDATSDTRYYPASSEPIDLLANGFGSALTNGDTLYLEIGTTASGYGTVWNWGSNDYIQGSTLETVQYRNTAQLSVTYSEPTPPTTSETPEPATISLFGLGLSGLAGAIRKRRRS